jgi:uncharacterized membrane protein YraQ (UPF0718 family)
MPPVTDKEKSKQKQPTFLASLYKAARSSAKMLPVMIAVILLLGLLRTLISKETIAHVFTGRWLQDTLLGSAIGSVSAGNAVTSYIIGGELLKEGISLFAVTAFIVAWVTVGIAQFPLEASALGKRFACVRNGLSFLLSLLVGIATTATMMVIK